MVEIRKAEDKDKPAVWQIIRAVLAGDNTYVFPSNSTEEEMTAYWFATDKLVFVALSEGVVVGTFWIKANQPGHGEHVANAAYMVAPAASGKGVGKKMALFSLDTARQAGFTAMQFNIVIKTNTVAVKLWQSIGFEIIGEIPDAFDNGRDGPANAYIMYRKL